jgi:light-harvesting complex II chlorophyll a/b binding protein 4
LTGTAAAAGAAYSKRVEWNPNGLDVSMLPGPLKAQFVPAYLKTAPSYLDGSIPGDIGFDPWGLVALANPSQATDAFARTAKARDEQMLAMEPEQQQQKLAWMAESELKHGRLAMLAAAGWPIAELYSGDFLHGSGGTDGRAPSLFNGHLLDYLPFLVIIFGPLAFLEFTARGKPDAQRLGVGGDYGFDPMGLAGPQKPPGAFPFESFMGSKTPIDGVRYAKDMDAMKIAEIKNGRVAMMGITGMAVQETLWGTPVVDQTPFFFGH